MGHASKGPPPACVVPRNLTKAEQDALVEPFYAFWVQMGLRIYRRVEAEGRLDELLAGTYRPTPEHRSRAQ